MKKNSICIASLLIAMASYCQQSQPSHPLSRQDYLTKSKNQKTVAWILLGGGTALIATGLLVGDGKEASFGSAETGVIVGGIGVLSAIGSIPLFTASAKNKRKSMSVSFKNRMAPAFFARNLVSLAIPSVNISIGL